MLRKECAKEFGFVFGRAEGIAEGQSCVYSATIGQESDTGEIEIVQVGLNA